MTEKRLPDSATATLDQICALAPVIPVLTINREADALPIAEALLEGGLPVLEITLRTDVGLRAIEAISKAFPEARVGAGTVLNAAQYRAACEAGSAFIVSPGCTDELLQTGIDSDIPLLPGIQSVSELMPGLQRGYQRFKFFPAEVAGGVAALKAFQGPFPDVRFCPTGGIKLGNAPEYLAQKNVMCVGGTWLTPADLVDAQDWSAIAQLARQCVSALRG